MIVIETFFVRLFLQSYQMLVFFGEQNVKCKESSNDAYTISTSQLFYDATKKTK